MWLRPRFTPTTTHQRITLTERDILWFEKINQHGPLATSFLYAYCKGIRRSLDQAKRRLADLYHEDNTAHGGTYLDRPRKQRWGENTRTHELAYELTERAEGVLIDRGVRLARGRTPGQMQFHHRLMVAAITASIELACDADPTLTFISEQKILARKPDSTLAIPCSILHRFPGGKTHTCDKPVIPDALFGIKSPAGVRFYALEADRNNMPLTRTDFELSSYLRKLLQYRHIISSGAYKDALGIPNLMMLTVTTSEQHMQNIVDLALALSEDKGNNYLLFDWMPECRDELVIPRPKLELLTTPKRRAGRDAISLIP